MTQAENEEKRVMRVIVCRPGELAEVKEIDTDLKSMQEVVGGFIEEYMPFTGDDPREDLRRAAAHLFGDDGHDDHAAHHEEGKPCAEIKHDKEDGKENNARGDQLWKG